jgi:pyruvate dehydrogenase E1 component alpha subunit
MLKNAHMTKQPAAKKSGSDSAALSKEKLMKFYYDMLLVRRFEEKAGQLYGMGLIAGFCHLYIGQEAVVVGMQNVLEKGDSTVTSYRDHGHIIASGIDPKEAMAELTGRATGCSRGKGGSMHMFNTKDNFYGGHGIVGAQVPIGTGLAFANKYRKNGKIAVTYLGDGAINQGQVYESFNMAKLWNLPVIYVVENNEYAMGTAVKRSSSEVQLYKRGLSFGIPGEQVDGMDVTKVYEAATKAAEFVRGGNGPIILEMKTYRYRGHSMSDPAKYRSKEEVEKYKQEHDPIERLKKEIETRFKVKEDEFKAFDVKIKDIIRETEEFAKNSPEPDEAELWTDVYNEK